MIENNILFNTMLQSVLLHRMLTRQACELYYIISFLLHILNR